MPMEAIVEVRELVKRYGKALALDGLGFSVERGEVFALLGPNGAGKTTALEIIEGIRRADSGSVRLAGVDALAHPDQALRHVGVQLQAQGLPSSMTVRESMEFFSYYRGSRPQWGLLERLGLDRCHKTSFGNLSMGLQRRLMLALALAHSPDILILDEPTASLDVESRASLHAIIQEERAKGRTVILASHDMAEVEKLADRALVMVRGRPAALGSPRSLTNQGDTQTRLSLYSRDACLVGILNGDADLARAIGPFEFDKEGYLRLRCENPGPILSMLLARIEAAGDRVMDLRVERPSLEERFLALAGAAAHSGLDRGPADGPRPGRY